MEKWSREMLLILIFSVLFIINFQNIEVQSTNKQDLQVNKLSSSFTTVTKQNNQTYGGNKNDHAYSVIQTLEKGYLLVGSTESFGAGNKDIWLVNTDENGTVKWSQTYGGIFNDVGYSVVQTTDGGYAFVGYSESYGAGNADVWLIKIDDSGNILWNQTYGGPNSDFARSLIQTADGGYAIAGYTGSYGAGNDDMWLIKTNENGTIEWSQTYGGAMLDHGYSFILTKDGGYALVGKTMSFGAGQSDMWLVKTNETGASEWNQTYGGIEVEEAVEIVQTPDGRYMLAGSTYSFGLGSADIWMIRTNEKGVAQWDQTYGGMERDSGYTMINSFDEGYALAGRTWSFGVGNGDMWLVKTNENGITEWNQTFGGIDYDAASKVIQTVDREYILVGSTYSFGSGSSDMWLVRIETINTPTTESLTNITLYPSLIGFFTLVTLAVLTKSWNK